MSEELIYINPGECLPGFPSGHGPGLYLVDREARTIRPAPSAMSPLVVVSTVEQPTEEATPEAQPVEEPTEEQGG